MATIVVEDGSGVTSANSYVTTTELQTYADDRGITITEADLSVLLIKAMDYIESLEFKGIKLDRDQALQWPRANVYIDGYFVETDEIPKELKNAQMATALAIDAGNGPLDTLERKTVREKVDVIEVQYAEGSSSAPTVRTISASLKKLVKGGNYGLTFNVWRG